MSEREGPLGTCDACMYEGVKVTETEWPHATRGRERGETTPMCDVCRATFIGNAHLYPEQYRENGDVLKAIGFGINYVADVVAGRVQR